MISKSIRAGWVFLGFLVLGNTCTRVVPTPQILALLGVSSNANSSNSSNASSATISFSNTSYTFTNGTPISALTPSTSSTPTSCSATPSLPTGLNLSSTCVISGTPTVTQSATVHKITAEMSEGSASTDITVTVNANISSAKAITSFRITTPSTSGFITGNNISVTVPFGTAITSLVAVFTTTGVSVRIGAATQTSGVTTNNFSSDVVYTVTAEDGSSSSYTVSVIVASNTAKDITSFGFNNSLQTTFTGNNISVLVPNGTSLTSLIANFTATGTAVNIGAIPQTSGVTTNDFSAPVSYVVTAGDSSTKTYTVTVSVAGVSDKDITAFSFISPAITGSITGTNISITVPFGSDVTALVANFTSTGSNVRIGSTTQTSGTSSNNFSSPITYIVTAADSSTKSYLVTVTIAASTNSAIVNGSFQSGTITNVINTSSATLSRPVDLSKSFVYCGAKIGGSAAANMITCQLTSPTTVSVTSGQSSATGTTANWYVVEYAFGVTVQRGSSNMTTGASGSGRTFQNITINAVDLTKSFVIVYTKTTNTSLDLDEERSVMGYFLNNTSLRLARQSSSTFDTTTEWQVVEFSGANVQSSGSAPLTLAASASTVNQILGSSVDLTKSFLLFNVNASSGVIGREEQLYLRGRFSSTNTITFTRRGNDAVSLDISWYVIEMTDGTTVQNGSTTIAGGGGTSVAANLGSAVNTGKTMVVWTNDTVGENGVSNATSTQDSGTYSVLFNTTTQLQFERNNDENNAATIDWFTIEFQ